MKKLFVTDVDGTLLQLPQGIPSSTLKLIAEISDKGHYFSICTGRNLEDATDIVRQINLKIPYIILTGAMILNYPGNNIIRRHTIDKEIMAVIIELLKTEQDLAIVVTSESGNLMLNSNEYLFKRGTKADRSAKMSHISDIDINTIYKILLVHSDHNKLVNLKNSFTAHMQDKIIYDFASDHFVEIVSCNAGKGNALIELSKILNVNLESVYYAGDGLTDLSAIKLAGTSFAPKNALPKVKERAKYVIPEAKKAGLDKALLLFLNDIESYN